MRSTTNRVRVLLACTLLLIFVGNARAQTINGRILGTVRDQTGAALRQATVTVSETATAVSRTVTTDDSGEYVAAALPPGM